MRAQPPNQHGQITLRQSGIQARRRPPCCRHQLRRRHRTKRVRREIADRTVIPMDVLQNPFGIIGRRNAQQRMQPVIPGARQVGHRQVARNQRLLQLEPQNDMGGIGHFIGIDADETSLDMAGQPPQIGRCIAVSVTAIGLQQLATEPAEIGIGPAGLHFDDQRLAFMRRHTGGLTNRLAGKILGQSAFIQCMPGFVQHPHHGRGKVVLVISGGNAHIGGRATAERVGGAIEPGMRFLQPGRTRQAATQGLRRGWRKRAIRHRGCTKPSLQVLCTRQGIAQKTGIIGEYRRDILRPDAALIAIH